ncbi:uncharacterized protein DS421_5g152740 [Arachis hypogaea]|nr:uncharacterized protein DS421_5g152740 [Arachis hypogaea]
MCRHWWPSPSPSPSLRPASCCRVTKREERARGLEKKRRASQIYRQSVRRRRCCPAASHHHRCREDVAIVVRTSKEKELMKRGEREGGGLFTAIGASTTIARAGCCGHNRRRSRWTEGRGRDMMHRAAHHTIVGSLQRCRSGCWRRTFELVGTAFLFLLELALVPARPCPLFSLHRSAMSLEKHYLNWAKFTVAVVAVSNSVGLDTLT